MKVDSSPLLKQISPVSEPSLSSTMPSRDASSISSLPLQVNSTASPWQSPGAEPVTQPRAKLPAGFVEDDVGLPHHVEEAGVTKRTRLPSASVSAGIWVVMPPLERPMALLEVPVLCPVQDGGP